MISKPHSLEDYIETDIHIHNQWAEAHGVIECDIYEKLMQLALIC